MHWIRRHRTGRPPHPDVLTPAEWRVLEHVREGLPNAEIAVRLGVSINTVRTHVSSMLAKLDLPDRRALAQWQGEPAEASRHHLERTRFALPFADWPSMLRLALGGGAAVAGIAVLWLALGNATDGGPRDDGNGGVVPTPTPAVTATEEPAPTSTPGGPSPDGPHRRIFAPGETIDAAPAVLFIEPSTGETEAWVFPGHTLGGEFGVAPDGSYIVWRDTSGYRLFRPADGSDRAVDRELAGLPIAYGPGETGFAAYLEGGGIVSSFRLSGSGPELGWRAALDQPVVADWSQEGDAAAIAQNVSGTLVRMAVATEGSVAPLELSYDVPDGSPVSVRWSHAGDLVVLVTADRIRTFSVDGTLAWEFEGEFYGNPRWSADDQHLYVNAMPDYVADVAYLFTAGGQAVLRFVTPFASGCGGEVWVDDDTIHFGEHLIGTDGSVQNAARPSGLFPDLSSYGVVIGTQGVHLTHYADEYREHLDDGRLVVTTPEVGHGGCATSLSATDFEPYLERHPFDGPVPRESRRPVRQPEFLRHRNQPPVPVHRLASSDSAADASRCAST